MPSNTLEIPSYGGPTAPAATPSRGYIFDRAVRRGLGQVASQLPNFRNQVVGGMQRGNCPPGCCSCGTNQPPYKGRGQPYSQPGLGQPDRPQTPFQTVPDPCMPLREALQRVGIDPDDPCLKKVMGRGAAPRKRKAAAPRSRKAAVPRMRKAAAPKTKRAASRSRAPHTVRGQYWLLQNGACYNPKTRKFVKRANCR